MNILKILGIVAGIHVVAFFLMFVSPGCSSTSQRAAAASDDPPPAADPAQPAQPAPATPTPAAPAPAAAAPSDSDSGAAVSVNVQSPAAARYSPTRPGTPASEALANEQPVDVTPATTYTVAHGDSLSKIAKKNHTTVDDLMKANHLTSNSVLHPGQKLIIPGKEPAGAPAAGGAEPKAAGNMYTVKPGDTLAAIAHGVGSTTAELKKINNLRSDYVQVGQELKLPAPAAATAAPAPAAASPAASPAAAPTAAPAGSAPAKSPEGALTHEVKPGETIGAIARKYHVRTQDLLVANNIADPRKIRPGQTLVIPGGSAPAPAEQAVKPSLEAPAGQAPAAANTATAVQPAAPAGAPALDAGARPQGDVPVIKVDDTDTKNP